MSYQSPITMSIARIVKDIIEKQDGYLVEEVRKVGFDIDKEELEKALKYDRDQYMRGYSDGRMYRPEQWIPVTERLPGAGEIVLVYGKRGGIYTAEHNRSGRWPGSFWKLNSKSHYCEPTHWMPLPTPPEEKTE